MQFAKWKCAMYALSLHDKDSADQVSVGQVSLFTKFFNIPKTKGPLTLNPNPVLQNSI